MAKRNAPINMIVHFPSSEKGKRELANHVADVHALMVNQSLKKLNCPSHQKTQLVDAVITSAILKKGSTPF